ncbi:MAG TPA: hypothetical protein VMB81_07295 [Candidatus Sulfotelmatobacter sp.]|nr:hypothetical protein [Candidatus Sulfotelmatobacter sp.]
MRRFLTTVAFSALVLGVAAPGWAADPTSTAPTAAPPANAGSASPTTSSSQMAPSAQANQPTSSDQAASGAQSSSKQATNATSDQAAPKKKVMHRHFASARSRSDHMANELNRQELAKITGAESTSYGSSGVAPTTGTTR